MEYWMFQVFIDISYYKTTLFNVLNGVVFIKDPGLWYALLWAMLVQNI